MRVELSSTDSEQRVDVGIAITCGTPCEKDQASRTVETLSGSEYSVHCGLCHSVSFDLDGGDGPFLNRNALSVHASVSLRTPSTHALQLASTAIPKIIRWGGEWCICMAGLVPVCHLTSAPWLGTPSHACNLVNDVNMTCLTIENLVRTERTVIFSSWWETRSHADFSTAASSGSARGSQQLGSPATSCFTSA